MWTMTSRSRSCNGSAAACRCCSTALPFPFPLAFTSAVWSPRRGECQPAATPLTLVAIPRAVVLLESEGGGAELSVPNKNSPLVHPVAVGAAYKAVVDFLLRSPAAVEGDEGVAGEGEGGGEPRWSGARRASIGVGVAVRDGGCRAGAIPSLGHRVTLLGIVEIQGTGRGEPGSGDGGLTRH